MFAILSITDRIEDKFIQIDEKSGLKFYHVDNLGQKIPEYE